MEKLVVLFFLLTLMSMVTWAESSIEFLAKTSLPSNFQFKKTKIGGLSGLVFNPDKKLWVAVCDDRGRINEPRFYELDFQISKSSKDWKLTVDPKAVVFVRTKDQKRWKGILDLEGITVLPWGNYLFSNEGDMNHKPREMPTLLDVKAGGTWARDFALPDHYLPEKTGAQTKGTQNNRAGEGLTSNDSGNLIWVAMEGPLLQDLKAKPQQVRIQQYEMPEAWIIKPTQNFWYRLDGPAEALIADGGISEIMWLQDKELLVLERYLGISSDGLRYDVKVFQVRLDQAASPLEKKLLFDFKTKTDQVRNFEAMSFGPVLPDGRKSILIVSDNNFVAKDPTEFWIFALNEEKSK